MAEVIGPCSTLPGALHPVPVGTMCDDHPDVPAVKRVQGETDSFGAELNDLCEVCYKEHQAAVEAHKAEDATGVCDWCKKPAFDLRPRRDYEEGLYGRLYDVCGACVKSENDMLQQELDDDY
jgi:hypothetical protein